MDKQQQNSVINSLTQNVSQGLEDAKKNLSSQASQFVKAGKKLLTKAEDAADKAKDVLEVKAGQALNFAERDAIPKARQIAGNWSKAAQDAQSRGSEAAADISFGARELWQNAKEALAQRAAPAVKTHSTDSNTYGGGYHVTNQSAEGARSGVTGIFQSAKKLLGNQARQVGSAIQRERKDLQKNETVSQLSQNVKNAWEGGQSIASEVFGSAKKVLTSGARSVANAVNPAGREPQYRAATYNQRVVDRR